MADTRASAASGPDADWPSVGRTYATQHYSPLTQIHTRNVKQLGLAWFLDLPGERTLQATPLAVNGVLYFSGTNGKAYAVDARGKRLWKFDPDLTSYPPKSRTVLFGSNRGVAFLNGRIYVGTQDGRLVALDAKTGAVIWTRQTLDEAKQQKTISGAPTVFNGKVMIGHSGYDNTRSYVTAYDARTGNKVWRFYSTPGNPAKGFENAAMSMAAKTWTGEWWRSGGHATVWDSIVYDPAFNRVYFGTASAMSTEQPPRGDKLFASSIVALDADTGKYAWHYQVNPANSLEYEANYDATMQIVLAELMVEGKTRKVLMQAPKNGFFYVIDRATGKLISAEKLGEVTWAERIDLQTGRPVPALYKNDGTIIWPSAFGMHSWQRMSFHPGTGLAYIPIIKRGACLGGRTTGQNPGEPNEADGALLAWDPVMQRKRWEIPYADSFWNGGTLATAGNLIFHGTGRGQLIAYDARTGENLWSFDAGLGINAAPMTYVVGGVQYISLLVGYGGTANMSKCADYGWRFNEQPRRLLTFAIGAQVALPSGKPPRFDVRAIDDPSLAIDITQASKGSEVYGRNCIECHGIKLQNYASIAPDLRESTLARNWDAFEAVVHEGSLVSMGMPRFGDLSNEDLRAVYMYIRREARAAATSRLH